MWANQWEPATKSQEAFFCYTKRFGENHASNVDIFKVNKREIPNHTLLVGGFPCQDYSVAQTLANSKGIEGKKGVLWWAINDILKIKKPPFVFLENVDRLLLSPAKQRGRDFGIILRSFFVPALVVPSKENSSANKPIILNNTVSFPHVPLVRLSKHI